MYINTQTGEYPISMTEIKAALSNTSFPSQLDEFEACLPGHGFAVVQTSARPAEDHTKNVVEGTPSLSNGSYHQTWVTTAATAEEIAERTASKASEVRAARTALLSACDWTQLADSPVQPVTAWQTYRAGLRNISTQPGFPWDITWPVEPNSEK